MVKFGQWGQSTDDADAPAKTPASGPELAMKAMGLGSLLPMVKEFAASGSVQKLMKFSNDLEGLDIVKLKHDVEYIRAWIERQERGDGRVSTDGSGLRSADVEPGSRTGTSGG